MTDEYNYNECPYCKKDVKAQMIHHDPLNEDESTVIECSCGNYLEVTASYSVDYYVRPTEDSE